MSLKKKLHLAPPQQTKLWFQFHLKTRGYNYFSRLDGKKTEPYIIFYRHHLNPNLIKLVNGEDQSIYTRSSKKGWSNGVCFINMEIDLANMKISESEQLGINFDTVEE
jgi:hypothetical protein